MGGRLDTLQAAILDVKLKLYNHNILKRQNVADFYTHLLKNQIDSIPFVNDKCSSVWAQYSIRLSDREFVQKTLKEKGIPTAIYYPKPLHLQECFRYLGYKKGDFKISEAISKDIISLPMNPYLSNNEQSYIVEQLLKII